MYIRNIKIDYYLALNKFKQSNKLIFLNRPIIITKMQENLVISCDKNSMISDKSLGSMTVTDKTDQDTEKNFISGKSKMIDNSQSLQNQQDHLSQQNYDKLFDIFQELLKAHPNKMEEVNNISSSFVQFTAAELLQKSASSLWKSCKAERILTSYCKTLTTLADNNFQLSMISTPQQQYIGVKIGKKNNKVYLFEPEPMAIQFFTQRSQFLEIFEKKIGSNFEDSRLSELSREIIFLYSEYKKLRKRILKIVEQQKNIIQKDLIYQQAEQELKKLTKQLKLQRKRNTKKVLRSNK